MCLSFDVKRRVQNLEKDCVFEAPSAPREVAFAAGKQHGLAGSRRPFLDLSVPELGCQPLRPKPSELWAPSAPRESSFDVNRHVQNLEKDRSRVLGPKCSLRGCLRSRETAWPGGFQEIVFGPERA